jgi:hypothetical protein
MPLSESLFDDLVPPEVWATLGTLEEPEHDHILLTVRVKEVGRRSVSVKVPVTRYAPTSSVFLAVSKAITALEVSQGPVDKGTLQEQLQAAVAAWVDPF